MINAQKIVKMVFVLLSSAIILKNVFNIYYHAMGLEEALALMEKIAPGSKEPLRKYLEPEQFKLYVGFLNKDQSETLLDTVIVHPSHQDKVIGIKTLMYYPYFKLVWKQREDYDDVVVTKEYNSIADTYNAVYESLAERFTCTQVKEKGKYTRKVIFSDRRLAFIIDLINGKPIVTSKVGLHNKRSDPYDINECIKESKEVRFNFRGITITVMDFVMHHYLIPYYKLLAIFNLVPQIRIRYDQGTT